MQFILTIIWLMVAIYMNSESMIARSYARWFWLMNADWNSHRFLIYVNLITPTAATAFLMPLILSQYLVCAVVGLVFKPPRGAKWSFCRFTFVSLQMVWHNGRYQPLYRYFNGDLI